MVGFSVQTYLLYVAIGAQEHEWLKIILFEVIYFQNNIVHVCSKEVIFF